MPGPRPREAAAQPYPHARIRSIDTAAARAPPGSDRGRHRRRPARCPPRVRPRGRGSPAHRAARSASPARPWSAWSRRTPVTAEEALAPDRRSTTSRCRSRDEPPTSLADGAPITPREARRAARPPRLRGGHRADHPNVCSHSRQAWGDIDGAFAEAHLVSRATTRYPCATRTPWSRTTRSRRGRRASSRSGRPASTRTWSAKTSPTASTCRCPRSGSSCPMSAAATAASRTPRSSR